MPSHEIVNAKMERDRQLVHLKAFAVAKTLALKPVRFSKSGESTTALRSAASIFRALIASQTRQRAV